MTTKTITDLLNIGEPVGFDEITPTTYLGVSNYQVWAADTADGLVLVTGQNGIVAAFTCDNARSHAIRCWGALESKAQLEELER